MSVSLQTQDFDIAAEVDKLTSGDTTIGAVVTFTGLCRDIESDDKLIVMTLEHYPAMAQAELERIEAEAHRRWPLQTTRIVHRFGRFVPGDRIVLVIATSRHRAAAFEAATFMMDYLKTQAPFWKSEETAKGKAWVNERTEDKLAAKRWSS